MERSILAGLLSVFVGAGPLADNTAVEEFERKAQSLGESISADNSGLSVRCRDLARQVEELKGRPQRRYSAQQDYLQECERDPALNPSPEPFSRGTDY